MNTPAAMTVTELEEELKSYFKRTNKEKPNFSVRQMAMQMQITYSTLNKIISGQRHLGFHLAREIGQRYNIQVSKGQEGHRPRKKRWVIRSLDPQSESQVGWVNIAILEMLKLGDFEPRSEWIARRLGLEVHTVDNLLNKMEAEGILERNGNEWRDLLEDAAVAAKTPTTSETIRKTQKDLFSKASRALDEVDYESRENTFSVFPVAADQIPRLKKKILEFSWHLADISQRERSAKNEVYALQLALFPLTKLEKSGGPR